MKDIKKKKNIVKNRINNNYLLLLIFIATIFMSVGYASINSIILNVTGTGNYSADKTLHISAATSAHSDSTINSFSGTMLNSTVDLTNNNTETFTITIFNNTNTNYMFKEVLRDTEASLFYDNQNITFSLSGLNVHDTLIAGQSVTFTVTFSYVNGFTPSTASDKVLNSYINFKFGIAHTVTYNNIDTLNKNYDTVVFDNDNLVVTFYGDVPYDVKVTSGTTVLVENTDYTYVVDSINSSNKILTVNGVTDDITIDRYYEIVYNLDGGTNNPNNPSKYLHGASESISAATKTSYMFGGWFDNSGLTGTAITSTSGKTGTLTLYAKWTPPTLAGYITALTTGYNTSYTGIITATSESNTCTNTLAYDQTTDNNLRYVGATPCNYIKFNCSGTTCETWRIIGIMNGIDSNPVIKIMRDTSYGSSRYVNGNKNSWPDSTIYSNLNGTFLTTLTNNGATAYMVSAPWNIGGIASSNTASAFYTGEIATKSANAYVGIYAPSDYGFAVGGASDSARTTCLNTSLNTNYTSTCKSNNWIYDTSANFWTLIPQSNSSRVYRITSAGVVEFYKTNNSNAYKPVVYLSNTVLYKTGNGSSGSPFEIE